MRQLLLLLILLFTFKTAHAQLRFSDNPDEFLAEAKALLQTSEVDNTEQLSAELEQAWRSGKLSSKQQKEIISTAQSIARRHLRANPYFAAYFTMVAVGVNKLGLQANALNNMLDVTAKAVKQEDAQALERFLFSTSLYLSSNNLFQSPAYRLRCSGGSFSFAYEGVSKAQPEKEDKDSGWDISWDDDSAEAGGAAESADDGWGPVIATPKKGARQNAEKNARKT